jgi:hypothetical protein
MIQTFSYYNQKPQSLFETNTTVISKAALEKILIASSEYCFVISSTQKFHECIDYFRREHHGVYVVAAEVKKQKFRMILCTRKPTQNSEEFKSKINNICEINKCDAIYSNSLCSKLLREGKVYNETQKINVEYIEQKSSEWYGRCKIFGLEIPLNETAKQKFKKAGLMFYPVTDQDFRYAKPWKQLLTK